jgi:hypothetical protein
VNRLALALALAACGTAAPRPEPLAEHRGSAGSSAPVAPVAAINLELVEGTPQTLPDGTVVSVKNVMYAHMGESRNLSRCTLVLARGAETKDLELAREHPSAAEPVDALGWRFALDMADAYQQPSRAIVNATKL